jgi:Tol biopolymer transport system component
MKFVKNTLKTVFIMISFTVLSVSCMTYGVQQDNTRSLTEAAPAGFSTEVDEPSVRGTLKRVSPDQLNVKWRFCLAPDGQSLVFTGTQRTSSGSQEYANLWKIPAAGGAPVRITSGSTSNFYSPSFTSDGGFIIYESEGQIWMVRSDGAGGKRKIPGSGLKYDVNPQVNVNDLIVFTSVNRKTLYNQDGSIRGYDDTYLIWTCDLDGGSLTQLREGRYPTWSPDGSKIVFEYDGDIWIINAEGTSLTQLTSTPNLIESLPQFSPDGEYIAFASNESEDGTPDDFNVWVMKTDGTSRSQMTELGSWDSWPTWGEDGLYFLSGRGADAQGRGVQRIWKIENPSF